MWRAFGIGALAAAVVGLSSHSDANAAQGPPIDGKVLFATYCASCHGKTGRGDGPAAEALRSKPADLTQFALRNGGVFPNEKVRRLIDGRDAGVRAHGNVEMPIWGDAFQVREGLSDTAAKGRIEAIMYYLSSIQQRPGR
jgi:mono/diheme cytochrome c family protein